MRINLIEILILRTIYSYIVQKDLFKNFESQNHLILIQYIFKSNLYCLKFIKI